MNPPTFLAGHPSHGSRAKVGGGRGIRTPDTLSGTTVFKTVAINHSAIPPQVGLFRSYQMAPIYFFSSRLPFPDDRLPGHERAQHVRNHHGTVGLLVVLENR